MAFTFYTREVSNFVNLKCSKSQSVWFSLNQTPTSDTRHGQQTLPSPHGIQNAFAQRMMEKKKGAIYWLLTKPIWGHSVTLWTDTAVPLLLYFGQSSCRTCVLYAANQPVLKHVAVTDMSNVNRDGGQRLKEFKEIVTVQKQHVHLGSVQVSQTAKQLTTQRSWNWKNVNVNVTLL